MHVTDPDQPPIVGHYIQPPFSVLDRRKGDWQKRTRWWRDQLPDDAEGRTAASNPQSGIMSIGDGISRFDPTLAEIFYRWWTKPGDRIYDPFAGGVTRGLVAQHMGRTYHGVDIRQQQVDTNRKHSDLWDVGDATTHIETVPADAVLTCPPYGDLERYSDDPRDLSAMAWETFTIHYAEALRSAIESMSADRYIGIVISDIRGKDGGYRGLPDLTRTILRDEGVTIVGDMVILDPIGRKHLTGWKLLGQSRKPTRVHQEMVIGVVGDPVVAAKRLWSSRMHEPPD